MHLRAQFLLYFVLVGKSAGCFGSQRPIFQVKFCHFTQAKSQCFGIRLSNIILKSSGGCHLVEM